MSHHAHDRREDRKVYRVGVRNRKTLRQQECKPDRCEPFEGVYEENCIAPSLSQDAQNIGCPDIPAPSRPDVNSRDTPSKIPHWEGSKQVTETTNGERKKPHDDELLRLKPLRSFAWSVVER